MQLHEGNPTRQASRKGTAMSSAMLDWVFERLRSDDQVIMPLKALWKEWHTGAGGPSYNRFVAVVLHDRRFEQVYSIDHDPQLETCGYFTGPRIKLRSREITEECLLKLIRSHNERIVEALFLAWEVFRNDPDSKSHGELRNAIQMLAELRPVFSSWTHVPTDRNDPDVNRKRPA